MRWNERWRHWRSTGTRHPASRLRPREIHETGRIGFLRSTLPSSTPSAITSMMEMCSISSPIEFKSSSKRRTFARVLQPLTAEGLGARALQFDYRVLEHFDSTLRPFRGFRGRPDRAESFVLSRGSASFIAVKSPELLLWRCTDDSSSLPAVGRRGRHWVRFAKTSRPALSASALPASENARPDPPAFSSMNSRPAVTPSQSRLRHFFRCGRGS